MGNKPFVEDDKMTDAYVKEARVMGEFLLRHEYKGLGDTIEAAAHRVQRKLGVPATILMRLRHRSEMKDMMVSSWFAIFNAYQKASARADEAYQSERSQHEPTSKMARLADFIAGKKVASHQEDVE